MNGFLKEKWTQIAAGTATLFAVCAAIAALKGGAFSTKTQITTTKENNAWAYFQSKSIKQHTVENQHDIFLLARMKETSPKTIEWLDQKIKENEKDIARYDQEKNDIKTQAEKLSGEAVQYKKISGYFGLAVMLLQISIMINAIAILLKKYYIWIGGMLFGAGGITYLLIGFCVNRASRNKQIYVRMAVSESSRGLA